MSICGWSWSDATQLVDNIQVTCWRQIGTGYWSFVEKFYRLMREIWRRLSLQWAPHRDSNQMSTISLRVDWIKWIKKDKQMSTFFTIYYLSQRKKRAYSLKENHGEYSPIWCKICFTGKTKASRNNEVFLCTCCTVSNLLLLDIFDQNENRTNSLEPLFWCSSVVVVSLVSKSTLLNLS